MPPINLIVNGTFDAGATGWTGTDIEANHSEHAYLRNGSANRVAEIDGHRRATTVMEQSFTVSGSSSRTLTFDTALRTASNRHAGTEGFRVEVVDEQGAVISFAEVRPTNNVLQEFTLPVSFPKAGKYTLRFIERGRDDSLGAIVDNVELMVCFAGPTLIATANGMTPARELRVGDWVQTARGMRPVRWVGRRHFDAAALRADPKLYPVKITAGALGQGLPERDLWVSRQHRILVKSPVCQRMFDEGEVLVAAIRLCELPGIAVDTAVEAVEYVHLLFDDHEIVYAEGALSESLLLGPMTEKAIGSAAVEEITKIFPELARNHFSSRTDYFIPVPKRQQRLVARLVKNRRPAFEGSVVQGDAHMLVMPHVAGNQLTNFSCLSS
jgi:hypothetical protein